MRLSFSPDEQAFQAEVRAFLDAHLTDDLKRAQRLTPSVFAEPDVTRRWQAILAAKGWVAPLWPKAHGGPGWSPAQVYIFESECARAGAPSLSPLGIRMVGPVIIGFGSPEQKAHYLPRILSGDDYWCQGYSEPGAGSDLASLKTRAVRDGDAYVLNGSKIWTTHAHHANRMFALVRTTDGPRKQDGISFLLIDMASPGIKVRPIITIGGDHEVNQVFFDDVRVPVGNLVGKEGAGWSYGKYLLEFERGSGISALRLRSALSRVRQLAATRAADDQDLLSRLDDTDMDIDALEMTELRVLSSLKSGQNPGHVSSLLKLRMSELTQAVTSLGVEALGDEALAFETARPLYGLNHAPLLAEDALSVVPRYLDSRAFTIFGGTSEVQREILAKAMLGL
jgi:acyl-CoA dehydrogenase